METRRNQLFVVVAGLTLASAAYAEPKNELSVAAGVDSAYDGNVYNGRGPDFVNRITPSASYHLVDPRIKIDAGYEFGYWTYAFGKANNSYNHRATLGVEGHLSRRLILRVGDELTRAEDPGFISRFGVVAPQIGIIDNVAEVSVGYAFTHRWYGAATYTNHIATFDPYTAQQIAAGLPPLFDGSEHDAEVALSYRVTRNDDFRFGGRFQNINAGPQSVSISRWSLANTYSPTVGWRHQFLRELEWSADAGPIVYQSLGGAVNIPGAPQDTGVTWRLGTKLRWVTPTWRAFASYTRDLLGATGAGTALWADFVYLQLAYHYIDKLEAHIGGGYFRNGSAINQQFAYDGFTADAVVDIRVINNLRMGAYYTLRWQEIGPGAIPPGTPIAQFPTVTRNIVGIRLVAVLGADAKPPKREVHE